MSNGLKIIITIVNIINGRIQDVMLANINSIPSETKNNVEKKSLKDRTLLSISILYGRFASATPATNAPIAIDKSIATLNIPKEKQVVIDSKKSISCDLAANLNMNGNTYFPPIYAANNKPITFKNDIAIIVAEKLSIA